MVVAQEEDIWDDKHEGEAMSITQINIWRCEDCPYQSVSVMQDVKAYSELVVVPPDEETWGSTVIDGKELHICPSCLKNLKGK